MTDGLPTLSVGDMRLARTAHCGSRQARRTPAPRRIRHRRLSSRESAAGRVHRATASAAPSWRAPSSASSGSTASATSTPRRRAACGSTRPRRIRCVDSACSIRCRIRSSRRAAARSAVAVQQHLQRRRDPARSAAANTCSSIAHGATARAYNGFYYSTDGGQTFARVNPTGALNPQDIGRTTFAYARDGSRLYALVESMTKYTNSNQTALGGIYVSPSGEPTGPWNKIAGPGELASKGSALKNARLLSPRHPGLVQPVPRRRSGRSRTTCSSGSRRCTRPRTAASHWTTIGPYWNFDFRCWSVDSTAQNTCPPTTHSDQHSIAIAGDTRVRRQRRRAVTPAAARHGERERQRDRLGEPEREHPHAAVLLGGGRQGRRAASQSPAACRTTADRCCCPKI